MALLEDRTAVFIVRIWCEGDVSADPAADWRGSVEHVQTGKRSFFRHLEAIVEFMRPHLERIGIDAQQRFWERISSVMDDRSTDADEPGIDPSDTSSDASAKHTARKSR